ncbi:alpha-hydroxy acid oxidase [Parafrankia sp. EAN1pec]|uniref:alpha-hydroxy acid oxidase n=1 Tax=Parafrankia sp. (strain EAN1pec) TaxID=298653 RepID=UPI0032197DE6
MDELEERAAAALPRDVYDYFRQGAGTHHALHEATPAWDALRLHPRVLRDVTSVRTATTVLGTPVDTPVVGDRPHPGPGSDAPWYGGHLLPTAAPGDVAVATDLTFDDITWLQGISRLPVVVKGVLRADDALSAVRAGARAVIVSNHGGRQLDVAVPTATALPGIARALVGTGAETYVDGGIRSGVHVLAALALGARAVLLGRPVLWALATAGADNVHRLLRTVTAELQHAMTLVGARNPDEITPDLAGLVDTAGAQPPG